MTRSAVTVGPGWGIRGMCLHLVRCRLLFSYLSDGESKTSHTAFLTPPSGYTQKQDTGHPALALEIQFVIKRSYLTLCSAYTNVQKTELYSNECGNKNTERS